jgi:hypothetical protein
VQVSLRAACRADPTVARAVVDECSGLLENDDFVAAGRAPLNVGLVQEPVAVEEVDDLAADRQR